MNNKIEEIISELNKAEKIAIICHARPDGDALGSGLALCLAMRNIGKEAYMFCEDTPPEKFSFVPSIGQVFNAMPNIDFDLMVSVDCADVMRMGIFTRRYKNFKKTTINLDHHVSNDGYAKLNYVKVCTASCEIITELFMKAGYEVTEEIADLLMIGLMTDSGTFTHQDVNEETFKIAAFLRSKGADINLINYQLNTRQPKARAILYGRVMNNINFKLNDKMAYIVITQQDLADCGADKSLTEGFVDFPLTIDGVEVSVSLLEYKHEQYKASLRSKGKVNVNTVATTFGGGGHVLASGCMLFGSLEEVVERIAYAVSQNL